MLPRIQSKFAYWSQSGGFLDGVSEGICSTKITHGGSHRSGKSPTHRVTKAHTVNRRPGRVQYTFLLQKGNGMDNGDDLHVIPNAWYKVVSATVALGSTSTSSPFDWSTPSIAPLDGRNPAAPQSPHSSFGQLPEKRHALTWCIIVCFCPLYILIASTRGNPKTDIKYHEI